MGRPTLVFGELGGHGVRVAGLDSNLMDYLAAAGLRSPEGQPVLRVMVVSTGDGTEGDLPDIAGEYEVSEHSLRFVPLYDFDTGVAYRAVFDGRSLPLRHPQLREELELRFSIPVEPSIAVRVDAVFPSAGTLPENLLRFYVRFAGPMQRGFADGQISLLDSRGNSVPDALYRAPVELWDNTMTQLTVLLDPGRLKHGVGPNRELGLPLEAGCDYALAIGPGMKGLCGETLGAVFHKRFRVGAPIRKSLNIGDWLIQYPLANARNPLTISVPYPLDWVLLYRTISVTSAGVALAGIVEVGGDETRWTFTPDVSWLRGQYEIVVSPELEDVCGNDLLGAFERTVRADGIENEATAEVRINFEVD